MRAGQSVYRRHTNFAMESIQQTFNGTADFNRRVSCQISRNGDLIGNVWLVVTLPTGVTDYVPYVGHRLVKSIEFEIGGQRIDKHYGDWLHIWSELTVPTGKRDAYDIMVGAAGGDLAGQTLYIPCQFFYNQSPGLALPLIALQYHEVKINIEFESLSNISPTATNKSLADASLWVDYVFLDTDERRRFAQLSHEYLISQLQFTGTEALTAGSNRIKLNFNHPVKELIWVCKRDGLAVDQWNSFKTSGDGQMTETAKIQLNGHDRFAERPGEYFQLVQPYTAHENVPVTSSGPKGINVYSFALKPEDHQPSGTLNFSRIDTAVLSVTSAASGTISVYAVNYNVDILNALKSHRRIRAGASEVHRLSKDLARHLVDGKPLKLSPTKGCYERASWPRSLDMVTQAKIGQPARHRLRSPRTTEHGEASETARVSVVDDGLVILRRLEIQSNTQGNLCENMVEDHERNGWARLKSRA